MTIFENGLESQTTAPDAYFAASARDEVYQAERSNLNQSRKGQGVSQDSQSFIEFDNPFPSVRDGGGFAASLNGGALEQAPVRRTETLDGGHADYYADGSSKVYNKDNVLEFTKKPQEGGGYSITYPDKTCHIYDASEHCVKTTSPDHRVNEYTWKDGKISEQKITYPDNSVDVINGAGVPLRSTTPDGRTTHYQWNAEGRLSKISIDCPNSPDHMSYLEFGKDGWHRYDRLGNDKGRDTFDMMIRDKDGNCVGHKMLRDTTVTDWQVCNIERGKRESFSAEEYREWREKTEEALKKAIAGGNRELVENLCREIGTKLDSEKRTDFLQKYRNDTGKDLAQELLDQRFHLAHRLITRDNPTDGTEKARVLDSIERLKSGDENAAHVLRESLAKLDSKQMDELKNSKPPLAVQLEELHKARKITENTYQSSMLYLNSPKDSPARQSSQFYEKLARIALHYTVDSNSENIENGGSSKTERLQLLREALSPSGDAKVDKAITEARQHINNDKTTSGQLEHHFGRVQLQEAVDLVRDGKASIFTRIEQNAGIFKDNPDNITRMMAEDLSSQERATIMRARLCQDNMTKTEREAFFAGKIPTTIGGKSLSQWGDAEQVKHDLEYLSHLRHSLESVAGSMPWLKPGSVSRDMRQWLDIAENGKPTLEGKIAGHYCDGKGPDGIREELQNMSPEDWARLKTDASYRNRIKQGVYDLSFKNASLLDEIDRMATADTYEKALGVSITSLKDNATPAQILRSLTAITSGDHELLMKSPELQRKYDNLISRMPDGADKEVARSVKERLFSIGAEDMELPPKLTPTEKLTLKAKDLANKNTSKTEFIAALSDAQNDPQTRQLLEELKTGKPESEAAKRLEAALKKELGADYEKLALPIIQQKMPIAELMRLSTHTTNTADGPIDSVCMKDLLWGLRNISQEDSKKIRDLANAHNDKELEKMLPGLNDKQRDLVVKVLSNSSFDANNSNPQDNGKVQPEDLVRNYIVDPNQDSASVREMLTNLSAEDREKVVESYAKKYGRNMMEDLQQRAPEGIRPELMRLASAPDKNEFEEAMRRVDEIEKLLDNPLFKETISASDSSGGRMGELLSQLARAKTDEERVAIKAKLAGAITDCQGSAQQVADTVLDAVYLASCLGTGGMSAGMQILAMASIGAVAKPGINGTVNGKFYGQRGEHAAEEFGKNVFSGAWGFGASGGANAGLLKAMKALRRSPEFESEVTKFATNCGTYQTSQIIANVIQQMMEQQMNIESHVTGVPKYTVAQMFENAAASVARGAVKGR